jgi:UDP-glucose 4-epimerase
VVVAAISIDYSGVRVLVTGGLGFIGSNLSHRLVQLGAEVTLLDALLPETGANLYNIKDIEREVRVNICDLRDEAAVNQLVQGQDVIFNLAAQVSHTRSMREPFYDLDINCRGHLTLLEACRKYNPDVKIVYTGTRSQYGRIQYTPVDEEHPINPVDTNGITKHAAEQYHLLYHNVYGMKTTSLRLTNTYGPRHQMRHSEQGFINWFLRLAMDDETINVFDGSQKRDLHYVDDVVEALLLAGVNPRSDGEVFNTGGEALSLLEIAQTIVDVAGCGSISVKSFPEERRRIEVGSYIADYTKIQKTLGWKPTTPFREGVKKTLEYYEAHRKHYW